MDTKIRIVTWYLLSSAIAATKVLFMIPPGVCRHRPTCTAYAREVVMRERWRRMVWLIGIRFLKCNPFFPPQRGVDGQRGMNGE